METPKLQTDDEIVTESGPQTTGEILTANVAGENQADGTFDGKKKGASEESAEDSENEGDAADAENSGDADEDITDEEEDDPDSDKDKA